LTVTNWKWNRQR